MFLQRKLEPYGGQDNTHTQRWKGNSWALAGEDVGSSESNSPSAPLRSCGDRDRSRNEEAGKGPVAIETGVAMKKQEKVCSPLAWNQNAQPLISHVDKRPHSYDKLTVPWELKHNNISVKMLSWI
ncbi:unnamed protein product [Ilex paraguariensis]|uniref:Uncharacterized protein n=1 Tax=Ilex paraguariensis TaxID=185542 RepID=A0ABC8TH61_9AQUA